jgi:hypothetical protein
MDAKGASCQGRHVEIWHLIRFWVYWDMSWKKSIVLQTQLSVPNHEKKRHFFIL